MTSYRRGAEASYSNELQGGQWAREPQARAVVEAERARPMTLQERRDYAKGFDELADMLAKPEHPASAAEVRKVADLQREAKAAVAAEVFRQEPPEKAEQQHPELVPAYGYIRAREAKAEADGLSEQQCAIVMARVRETVAERIERGDVPSVQIREERQVKAEQQRDPER
ncbi:MAG: hypothetical protein GKR94_06285 [Gammaproteobacteria bacterium]|nr:hypothetical protein [Gammaproteobacteria bacterium]NKC11810.1 hypothetical protein [Gammaproteobacteria bacterium]